MPRWRRDRKLRITLDLHLVYYIQFDQCKVTASFPGISPFPISFIHLHSIHASWSMHASSGLNNNTTIYISIPANKFGASSPPNIPWMARSLLFALTLFLLLIIFVQSSNMNSYNFYVNWQQQWIQYIPWCFFLCFFGFRFFLFFFFTGSGFLLESCSNFSSCS